MAAGKQIPDLTTKHPYRVKEMIRRNKLPSPHHHRQYYMIEESLDFLEKEVAREVDC
jgi:hypothetical protein